MIRNDHKVEKAEQGQYQRHSSNCSPVDYRLKRKGNASVQGCQSQNLVKRWSDEQYDAVEKVDYSVKQEQKNKK